MSPISSQRVIEMVNKKRENFVSTRALLEQDIDKFREQLEGLSDETKEKLGINFEDIDARTLFPSLYKPKLNTEDYTNERINYSMLMTPVVEVRKELLKKAQELGNV